MWHHQTPKGAELLQFYSIGIVSVQIIIWSFSVQIEATQSRLLATVQHKANGLGVYWRYVGLLDVAISGRDIEQNPIGLMK